jgi:hypothetical protein
MVTVMVNDGRRLEELYGGNSLGVMEKLFWVVVEMDWLD